MSLCVLAGPRSSALVGGYTCWHRDLEAALAQLKGGWCSWQLQGVLLAAPFAVPGSWEPAQLCTCPPSLGPYWGRLPPECPQRGFTCLWAPIQCLQETSWQGNKRKANSGAPLATTGTEECLLFPTGFAANVAVLSALCQHGDVAVFSDELNHASIVDGALLGRRHGSVVSVYRHNDLQHLEQLLEEAPPGGYALCPAALCCAALFGGQQAASGGWAVCWVVVLWVLLC